VAEVGGLPTLVSLRLAETPLPQLRNIQSKVLAGYETAIHSCTEHGPVRGLESTFDALGQSDLNVLVVHVSTLFHDTVSLVRTPISY
jgi:hypothetical protein